VKQDYEV